MKFLSKCCVATTGLKFELFFLVSLSLFLNLRSYYLLTGEYLNNTFQVLSILGDCITTTQKIYMCVCCVALNLTNELKNNNNNILIDLFF